MKRNQWWQATRTVMVVSVLSAATIGCSENAMVTRPAPPAARITTPQAATEPANADDILMRMAEFLAKTPRFSVNLEGSFEVVQASGRRSSLARPGKSP